MNGTSDDGDTRVGVDAMDGEHRVQIALVAALRDGLARGDQEADLNELLARFVDYSDIHFLAEQLLMRLHAYPEYASHQSEHDRLIEQVRALQDRFRGGDRAVMLATADRLQDWLLNHIRHADRALGMFLAAQPAAMVQAGLRAPGAMKAADP